MNAPRAVVIPFGVSEQGRGLGLGLAALVRSFVHLDGAPVAIAQLHAAVTPETSVVGAQAPLEAYVSPSAWRDMAARGDGPSGATLVLTGAFQPPVDGEGGAWHLLAFDPRDGRTRATVNVAVDHLGSGTAIVDALEQLCTVLGGRLAIRHDFHELGWESLESVLRAEGCALHEPLRGGPRDCLAAMVHLGRALDDDPCARYPAERLAAVAAEAASVAPRGLGAAAFRALERAAGHASAHVAVEEALASVLLKMGRIGEAERRLNAAIAATPSRTGLYVLLSQALRAQGRYDAALGALESGKVWAGENAIVCVEHGAVLCAKGDLAGAAAAWRQVLSGGTVYPGAFLGLGALALRLGDTGTGQWLADVALTTDDLHPEVARHAVHLVLATEAEGVARAARLARLAERWLASAPADVCALLVLGRALVVLGEFAAARARLDHIERVAPQSRSAAEARVLRLELDDPAAALDVARVLRAAHGGPACQLAEVARWARRLATLHDIWLGWLAAGIAEQRRSRLPAALQALELAVAAAPGAASVHIELARVLIALDQAPRAVVHAESAAALEGPSPAVFAVLARALDRAGRRSDAVAAARAGLALQEDSAELRQILAAVTAPGRRPGTSQMPWVRRTRGKLSRAWASFSRLSGT